MSKIKYISPIAIDMGAKNTACYFAHYKKASSLSQIKPTAKVFNVQKDNYTLLLRDRTSKRHQRRGIQRRKLAKKLLALILEKHFKMSLSQQDEQAIGFLLNRRGFNRIEQDFLWDKLSEFPNELKKHIPVIPAKAGIQTSSSVDELNPNSINKLDFSSYLQKLIDQNDKDTIQKIYKSIEDNKIKPIKSKLVYYNYIKKIKESAQKRKDGETLTEKNKRDKLSKTNKWIVEKMIEECNLNLTGIDLQDKTIDFLDYLNKEKGNSTNLEQLSNLPDYKKEIKDFKNSDWNWDIEKFTVPNEETQWDKKTHLNHLGELISGHLHRKKYFEEIKKALQETTQAVAKNDKKHPIYLINFIKSLNSTQNFSMEWFDPLKVDMCDQLEDTGFVSI